jgi:hypothetical protein
MNLLGHNVREGRHSLRSFVPLLVILGSLSILVAAQLTASVDPVLRLRAIPAARPEKYRAMVDMEEWKNPALTVQEHGIALLDPTSHETQILRPQDIPAALAQLPSSAWPYGRVVMASENGLLSIYGGGTRIHKNRILLVKALQGTKILINWVPAA